MKTTIKRKKQESNVITPDNLCDQEMSTLFYSCLADIEKVEELGIGIQMDSWARQGRTIKTCTVCLGGAALLGFVPKENVTPEVMGDINEAIDGWRNEKKIDGVEFTNSQFDSAEDMIKMFNAFRQGNTDDAIDYYENMSGIYLEDDHKVYISVHMGNMGTYDGVVKGKALKQLKDDILRMADVLAELGY